MNLALSEGAGGHALPHDPNSSTICGKVWIVGGKATPRPSWSCDLCDFLVRHTCCNHTVHVLHICL